MNVDRAAHSSEGSRFAVVTGGSSGIGRAFVASLHAQGWAVATCGRDAARLARLAEDFPGVRTHVCDVADPSAVDAFARALLADRSKIDLLINNAGRLTEIDFNSPDLRAAEATAGLRLNLESAVCMTAALLPALKAAPAATIVMITSGYALAPTTRSPIYSAAKAGLRSFTKALRRQLADSNVSVIEVAPPLVDTPAVAHRRGEKLAAEQVVSETFAAMQRGVCEVYPGKTRFLPLLLRLAPRKIENLIAAT
jgi:uncharacterized oxidoreductase